MDEHNPNDPSKRQSEDEESRDTHSSETEPTSEQWTSKHYPLVDADFVGNTLDRVMNDRDEISREAARVDDVSFSWELLDTYRVPEPSRDFVDETLKRVSAAHSAGLRINTDNESQFLELIQAYQVPEPSSNFVESTLLAARRTPSRSGVGSTPGQRPSRTLIASLAALFLCSVAIFWSREEALPPITAAPVNVRWASMLHDSNDEMNLRVDDRLTALLRQIRLQEKRSR